MEIKKSERIVKHPPISFNCSLSYFTLVEKYIKLTVPPIWIYIPSDAQLSPPSFGILKSVCWYGKFFYFSFVFVICSSKMKTRHVTRDRFTKRCSRAILSHTMTELLLLCIFVIRALAPCGILRLSVFSSDALNFFLPIPSHSMWKNRAIWKLSKRESSFSVNQSLVT